MMRRSTLLMMLLAGTVALVLFTVKYRVHDLETELQGVNRATDADRQAIRVLRAEWSHLNDPARLRALAERHLELAPMDPKQIGSIDETPPRPAAEAVADAALIVGSVRP